jgi:putative transposase
LFVPKRRLHETAGILFHVLNRGVRRLTVFEDAPAYRAFLQALEEGQQRTAIRLLAYCVMPNHFHLVVWPARDGQLVEFMKWFQMTHSKRWHRYRQTEGVGALYQGRFKAFPIQDGHHFLCVCRYVERNPVRAGLVTRAEDWPWSSLGQRCKNSNGPVLEPWPIPPPSNWTELVDGSEVKSELDAVRSALKRSTAYGEPVWADGLIARGVGHRRSRGRPPSNSTSADLPFA